MATKTNQPTTERDADQMMRDLDFARALDDKPAVARLSAELKNRIDVIFHAVDATRKDTIQRDIEAEHVEAIAEDNEMTTIAVELAHREALAEAL